MSLVSRYQYLFILVATCTLCTHLSLQRNDDKATLFNTILNKSIKAQQQRAARTVYVCGYGKGYRKGEKDNIVWRQLFPEYNFNVANFSANMNS